MLVLIYISNFYIFEILLEYMQVTSCFEGLFKRNILVQSEFKFDGWFKNYKFFKF
jgi:hypothetical protein